MICRGPGKKGHPTSALYPDSRGREKQRESQPTWIARPHHFAPFPLTHSLTSSLALLPTNPNSSFAVFPIPTTGGRVWLHDGVWNPFKMKRPDMDLSHRISPNAGLAGCDIPHDLTRPGRKELLRGTKSPLQRAFKFRPTQKDHAYSSIAYRPSPPIALRHRLTASN